MNKVLNTLRREIVCTPVFFLLSFSSFPALSEDSIFEEEGVPDGFELLAAPQLTVVDLYYGGRYLSSVKAIYTPTTLELSDPQQVVRSISEVTNPALVTEALTGPLDRHDGYICKSNSDCPTYTPDVAGVVFDESLFRVNLVVNRSFLAVPKELANRYLPPSTADGAFLQTFNLLFSGAKTSGSDSDQNETWTMFGRSLLSMKEKNVESLWDYDKERNFGFRSFSLNQDKDGKSWGAGLIQSQSFGLTFTSDQTMVGGRLGSSLRTLIDNGITQSSRLEVFRSNRGRVEVFRDGRLIHTEFQEAGNQLINTQAFPSGAYDITIRLYDGDVLSQEENRFFVKTTYLPPADEPQYFVELGQPVNMSTQGTWPDRQDGMLVRAGYNWRIGSTSSLSLAGAATGNEALAEVSGLKLGELYQISSSVMVADHQRYGFSATSFVRLWAANMNLNYRKLWSTPATLNPSDDEYLLLGRGFYQGTASLGIPIGKGSLDLRRSYYRADTDTRTQIIDGISYDTQVWNKSDYELRFRTDLSREQNKLRVLAGIELRQRSPQWYNRVGYQAEYNKTKVDGTTTTDRDDHFRVATTWYDRDTFAADVEVDGFAEKQNNRSTLTGGLRYTGQYFDSTATVSQVKVDDLPTVTSYSGSLNSSLITNGENLVLGGEGNTESGLLVKLSGQVKGEFDVIVNGQRHGYGTIGNSTLINLPAFDTYKVFIRPRGESYYDYDEKELEFTLYPGNVQSYTWNIEQVLVLIGQLLDADGNPIANAALDGVTGVADTDSDGIFQARISTGIRKLAADLPDGSRCLFELPEEMNIRRGVVLAGALTCGN